jgi:bacterioferritin (cytochrome b1)
MLEEQKDKNVTVKKEHRLIPLESSADAIKKELENVYKQIKNYEREISGLENKQAGGLITDKMSRLENILKEKTTHLDKLKHELSVLSKNSVDNQKKLKNNAGKEELETAMLKYNDEIKVLREKVRNSE